MVVLIFSGKKPALKKIFLRARMRAPVLRIPYCHLRKKAFVDHLTARGHAIAFLRDEAAILAVRCRTIGGPEPSVRGSSPKTHLARARRSAALHPHPRRGADKQGVLNFIDRSGGVGMG